MNIPKPIITPVWLGMQIPVTLAAIFLTVIKGILRVLRMDLIPIIALILTALFLASMIPGLSTINYLIAYAHLNTSILLMLSIGLTFGHLLAAIYNHHKVLGNCILILIGAIIALVFLNKILATGIVANVLYSLIYSIIVVATTIGSYSAYVITTTDKTTKLTEYEKKVIQENLIAALGIEKNSKFDTEPKSLQVLLRSYFSQSTFEQALKFCEDTLVKILNNEITKKNDDFEMRFNYLLSVLVQVMISGQITLSDGTLVTKIELTPKNLRWIDSPYFALEVKNDDKKEVSFVFAGTSVLPEPCPGVIWTHFADFVPLFSIGEPLMWFCSSSIDRLINNKYLEGYDKKAIGLSLGGSMARIAHKKYPNSISKVITYSTPGIMSWKTRSICFLLSAITWSAAVCIYTLITGKGNFLTKLTTNLIQPIIGVNCFNAIGAGFCMLCSIVSLVLEFLIVDKNSSEFYDKETHYRNEHDSIPLIGNFPLGAKIVVADTFTHPSCSHFACPSPKKNEK